MEKKQTLYSHSSLLAWTISTLMLIVLITVIVMNLGEAKRFVELARQAKPLWLIVGILMQVGTYVCAGAIWREVTLSQQHHLRLHTLARLSIEQQSMNQLVPTGGMAGTLLVIRALRRRGVPETLAMEALLVDTLSHYAAFAAVSFLSLFALWSSHKANSFVLTVAIILSIILAIIPLGIWWLLKNRNWNPPSWLKSNAMISQLLKAIAEVSPKRVLFPPLLFKTIAFRLAVFLLDSATLWAMMKALGTSISPLTAFIALVTASITSVVSILPGGVGGFEAGCTATLTLLGIPVEAALTGTLMLRGLSLWLPLIPGWFLARQEIAHHT